MLPKRYCYAFLHPSLHSESKTDQAGGVEANQDQSNCVKTHPVQTHFRCAKLAVLLPPVHYLHPHFQPCPYPCSLSLFCLRRETLLGTVSIKHLWEPMRRTHGREQSLGCVCREQLVALCNLCHDCKCSSFKMGNADFDRWWLPVGSGGGSSSSDNGFS